MQDKTETYAELAARIDPANPLSSAHEIESWLTTGTAYKTARTDPPYGADRRFPITLTPAEDSPYDPLTIHFKPVRGATDGLSALRVVSQKIGMTNYSRGNLRNIRPAPFITAAIEPQWTAQDMIDAVCLPPMKRKTPTRKYPA